MEVTGTPAQGMPATTGQSQTENAAALTPEQNNQTAPQVAKSDEFVRKAQQEREQWQKQKAIKVKEQEIAAREAKLKDYESKYQSYEQTKAQARLNPIKYLQEAGLTPEDLVQFQLNNGSPTPDLQFQQLKTELEQTKQQIAEEKKQQELQAKEQNQRAAQEAMESFKVETKEFVESKPEEFELINATDAHNLVIQTIEEHWNQSVQRYEESGNDPKLKPKILSKEEAADLVEKYLEDKVETVLKGKRFGSKYKKIEDALNEVSKDVQGDQKFTKTLQNGQPAVKTLHNGIAASALPGPSAAKTLDAKMQAALKRLQESKNS